MKIPKSTVEQWVTLQTVIDEGSFAKAAEKLHRSQSTISYTLHTLQDQLGVELLTQEGRRAVLTPLGEILLNRSRDFSKMLNEIERSIQDVKQGYESHLNLVVDALCAREFIMPAIRCFEQLNQQTKLDIRFEILSGPIRAIQQGTADIVITPHVPKGFLGEIFRTVEIQPYAHIDNPVHKISHSLTERDLKKVRYITVRDTFEEENRSDGWFGSELRYRVDSFDTSRALICAGVGFGWLPLAMVKGYESILKPLNLAKGGKDSYTLYLVQQHQGIMGPARALLTKLLFAELGK